MVKFSRELEAQLIPEWKEAFVNYRQLKKQVKKVKLSAALSTADPSSDGLHCLGFSLLNPLHFIATHFIPSDHLSSQDDEETFAETELVQSNEHEVREFFEKLEEELEKVNNFYAGKEVEFCERGEMLNKQLQILIGLKEIIDDRSPHSRRSSFSENERMVGDVTPVAEEMIAELERNGVSFIAATRSKTRKVGKPRVASMRIDIPATTPSRTISAVTSVIWEDLINGQRKEAAGGDDHVSRKKIQCAEKMIRGAFVELYKGLGLLKTFSSLNLVAFRKILKKFDKVSNQQASEKYLNMVKRSHFISSDKSKVASEPDPCSDEVVKLGDELESIFTKHFTSNDRKKAMKFLRPQQPKDSHIITFLVGLFTGSFVTLFTVYAILAHLSGIFSSSTESGYMKTVYPVFSMFALLSLHIFLYGCNIFMWRATRINHNFIFEFSANTALKHRDAFLICTSFMTMMFIAMLFCPFNICYRSTRYCFLRVMRNIACSPLYRVLMVDFFMADQLTSQIPLLRHMEFTACFFMLESLRTNKYEICTGSKQYKLLAYVISFLPYYWRAMQCARRYIEEGYDVNHLANAGKYISAMLAAAVRWKYAVDPTPFWLVIVVLSSTMATAYQLYWDFVKDWGLFSFSSRNFLLRDDLILQNKSIYYVSIAFNFILRLAWIETVLGLNLGSVEHSIVDFLLASLEIIRRGHWNFYRLENEHLNNVGRFRAIKTVPLPFRDME